MYLRHYQMGEFHRHLNEEEMASLRECSAGKSSEDEVKRGLYQSRSCDLVASLSVEVPFLSPRLAIHFPYTRGMEARAMQGCYPRRFSATQNQHEAIADVGYPQNAPNQAKLFSLTTHLGE